MQLGLCSRRRDDPCQTVTAPAALVASPAADHTSWQFWRPLRFTWTESRNVSASRTLRSSVIPLLVQPFMRTGFSRRAFPFSAPSVWNSLPQTVLISDCLSMFKSRLKTFLLHCALILVAIGGGSIYKVGGPDAERRRCQRDRGRSERRGQKPLSTFHLEVVKFFFYFERHFDKFVFPG